MEPIAFGMVFTGVTGGTLAVLSLLGKKISINEAAIKVVLEASKFGTILYLLQYISKIFL
ncbi:hypothetical protein LRS37_04720 [Neobacillus sedimentimangrovi]|uniref:Permease n=1 Tax=Neobacillus sedimentimangrovi TaxID=2699460 RepID=A0ABS8QG98_9BACI|nr:hypothetical protein [Neobacillus sedimentimangrovi]MCD4838185.1 hypothetical protein [Neobacillus sedimentimangrovi]